MQENKEEMSSQQNHTDRKEDSLFNRIMGIGHAIGAVGFSDILWAALHDDGRLPLTFQFLNFVIQKLLELRESLPS